MGNKSNCQYKSSKPKKSTEHGRYRRVDRQCVQKLLILYGAKSIKLFLFSITQRTWYALRPCIWEKISDFRFSRYFGLFGLSDFETSPVQDPCFRMSETFAKLTENFPETSVQNPCPKIIVIFVTTEYIPIYTRYGGQFN